MRTSQLLYRLSVEVEDTSNLSRRRKATVQSCSYAVYVDQIYFSIFWRQTSWRIFGRCGVCPERSLP